MFFSTAIQQACYMFVEEGDVFRVLNYNGEELSGVAINGSLLAGQ